jgi:hypothetical protein
VEGGEDFAGYGFSSAPLTNTGGTSNPDPPVYDSLTIIAAFEIAGNTIGNSHVGFVLVFDGVIAQDAFPSITVQLGSGTPQTFLTADAVYAPAGDTVQLPLVGGDTWTIGNVEGCTCFGWDTGTDGVPPASGASHVNFFTSQTTTVTVPNPAPTPISGQGDITDPGAWVDVNENIPPAQFDDVPSTVNYPLNGDGRYWFSPSATNPLISPITFIGNTAFLADNCAFQASIVQAATDGSELWLSYSTNGGATYTDVQIGPSLQNEGLVNSTTDINLTTLGATGLAVGFYCTGGNSGTGVPWNVALAITRNANEQLPWDSPNPFNAINYNCECMDNVVPTDTMQDLQYRILVELGFANQANNPQPGIAAFVQSKLIGAQRLMYRRYSQLHTRRMFRWKVNPGQRFYSLQDNDEDVLCNFQMDPVKTIEWAGIQDTRNVWYPLIEGIPPQLYTMITKPWRPARYEIRQCIELYPMPDQTYWLWMKAHFGLMSFVNPTDTTTIDSELVFLWALANCKAHYGQADANNVASQANAYRKELIAGTHQTAHYIPGTIAVPPAVRPTLIQFQNDQSG